MTWTSYSEDYRGGDGPYSAEYLAAIESNLSREKAISGQKILDPDKIIHIIDEDVVETVINSVGEAGI
ncbi:unnamed protein product [Rhizophagus irregularis]|nr:unnamed protein product [Rhizophagus irregularis]